MVTRRFLLLATLATAIAAPAAAHDYTLGALKIGHPWARATVAPTGGAFLSVENTGSAPDRLLRAAADIAGKVELHTHIREGDVMRMRAVEAIDLPAGQTVKLQPGGYHIMLFELKRPLKEGERFPLTLEFEKAGRLEVEIAVDKPGAGAPAGGHHRH